MQETTLEHQETGLLAVARAGCAAVRRQRDAGRTPHAPEPAGDEPRAGPAARRLRRPDHGARRRRHGADAEGTATAWFGARGAGAAGAIHQRLRQLRPRHQHRHVPRGDGRLRGDGRASRADVQASRRSAARTGGGPQHRFAGGAGRPGHRLGRSGARVLRGAARGAAPPQSGDRPLRVHHPQRALPQGAADTAALPGRQPSGHRAGRHRHAVTPGRGAEGAGPRAQRRLLRGALRGGGGHRRAHRPDRQRARARGGDVHEGVRRRPASVAAGDRAERSGAVAGLARAHPRRPRAPLVPRAARRQLRGAVPQTACAPLSRTRATRA